MGVVYKAEDTKLHRTVAIKALSADLVGDEKARTRFLREARAASAIDHPNICTVYEVNEVEDVLFFVMQYVDGKTLKKFVGGPPLPLDQALEFSLEIADAVAEAHRRNVHSSRHQVFEHNAQRAKPTEDSRLRFGEAHQAFRRDC